MAHSAKCIIELTAFSANEECSARAYDPTVDSIESGDESGDEEDAGKGVEDGKEDDNSSSSDSSDEDASASEADAPPLPTPVIDVIANAGAIERPAVALPIPFVSSSTPAVQPSTSTEAASLSTTQTSNPGVASPLLDHLTPNELQALMLASTSNTSQWGPGNALYTNDASFTIPQNFNTDNNIFTTPQGSLLTLLSLNDWAMEGQDVQGFNPFLAGDAGNIDWSTVDFGSFGMGSLGFDTQGLQSNDLGTFATPPISTSALGNPLPTQGFAFTPTLLHTAITPGHPTQTTFIFPPADSTATPISVPAPPAAPPPKAQRTGTTRRHSCRGFTSNSNIIHCRIFTNYPHITPCNPDWCSSTTCCSSLQKTCADQACNSETAFAFAINTFIHPWYRQTW
ncbi:hypothetical protein BDN72DRAFT_905725 [Pluteus cervinus]|uniref:Uncharacterized protein n=1 Tax=Pluteus cervinus TaxID=181527 RepID=A0ACD3A1N3_9AGAR|nr:hypothetical protein BDN72DRAFT_905725 [Pluteus cervinus]